MCLDAQGLLSEVADDRGRRVIRDGREARDSREGRDARKIENNRGIKYCFMGAAALRETPQARNRDIGVGDRISMGEQS